MSKSAARMAEKAVLVSNNSPEELKALDAALRSDPVTVAMADAHKEHQRIARRAKLEMLADVISLMIDAKIVESRGFAKYDTVGKARLTLINVLAEVV